MSKPLSTSLGADSSAPPAAMLPFASGDIDAMVAEEVPGTHPALPADDGLSSQADANANETGADDSSQAELAALLRQHRDRWHPILAVLRDHPWKDLVGSRELLDALAAQGMDWPERTLRLHLADMGEAGLIEREGRKGYRLTATGLRHARELTLVRRLGAIRYRMEETVCQLDIDPARGTGLVSINAYLVPAPAVAALCDDVESVFRAGLAVGSRLLVRAPGEDILGRQVPAGCVGVGTMCSLTLAAILLRRGVPTQAEFGGLLRMDHGAPAQFLELIRYDATTLSPNEIFIRANLTSVAAAAASGSGAITASFREAPMSALPALRDAAELCRSTGFPGILHIGRPGADVLNIKVHEGRVGIVLATGLNPLASLWEHEHSRSATRPRFDASRPMVGPAPYEDLVPYQDFRALACAAAQVVDTALPARSSSATSASPLALRAVR